MTTAATEETTAARGLQLVGKPALPGFTLTPKSLAEAMELAKLMADSELVPKDFRGKPGNVLIAVQMGAEVGLSPMQAMQSIAIVNGRPAIWGDAPLALVRASGLLEEIVEEWNPSTSVATCTVRRRGDAPIVRTFSLEDARRIEIISYDNGNRKTSKLADKDTYKSYPSRMCQMRARAFALRDGFGDVLKGLAVREEIEDHPDQGAAREPRNITPVQMPQSRSGATVEPTAGKPERVVERVPGSDGSKTVFEINGRPYETNGMTKEQMLDSFDLVRDVDAKLGKNTGARVLLRDFQPVESRNDLTEEQAKRYLEALRALLSPEKGGAA